VSRQLRAEWNEPAARRDNPPRANAAQAARRSLSHRRSTHRWIELRSLRFLDDDTTELDFEGVDTPDRTFVARRETAHQIGQLTHADRNGS
jgi:hypothetical protein